MLGLEEVLALAVFTIVVAGIILRVVDESVLALAGLVVIVALTSYTPEEAFKAVDWNVIFILLGMWIITGYMIEAGLAERIAGWAASRSRSYPAFLMTMALAAGFISMFVDNVLVILIFGSIVVEAARRAGANPVMAVLLIGFSANFMGTALLMGDLPPQLLHSVAGAEFLDFIWSRGRPSSFPLLTVTFILTLALMYFVFVRREKASISTIRIEARGSKLLLYVSVAFFAATVVGMAIRPLLGVELGFITMTGAALLALTVEVLRRFYGRADLPSFERILQDRVEWRALLFYATLFSLVGGLESAGILESIAERVTPLLEAEQIVAYTAFYWVVALFSFIVEHDALLLTFLYVVRDASEIAGIDPWPIYWGMAWSATLASNATVAAAPALYVAVAVAEKAGYRVRPSEFLRYSLTFSVSSLIIHYLITLPIWGMG